MITRAAYAGIQRYSTMWTGDNTATWDAMALSIPMFETLGFPESRSWAPMRAASSAAPTRNY